MSLARYSLNHTHPFAVASRHLNMTRAADDLRVTPAAVSRQIRALEAQIGKPLFLRTARCLQLSDDGEHFVDATDAKRPLRHGFGQRGWQALGCLPWIHDGDLVLAACEAFDHERFRLADPVRSVQGEADVRDQPSTPLARKGTIKVAGRPFSGARSAELDAHKRSVRIRAQRARTTGRSRLRALA